SLSTHPCPTPAPARRRSRPRAPAGQVPPPCSPSALRIESSAARHPAGCASPSNPPPARRPNAWTRAARTRPIPEQREPPVQPESQASLESRASPEPPVLAALGPPDLAPEPAPLATPTKHRRYSPQP